MTSTEIGVFLRFFNRGGYVLNFTTSDFDAFTQSSIGVALHEHYGASKGSSLSQYCREADEKNVEKLLFDLFEYNEAVYSNSDDIKVHADVYQKCKEIYTRKKNSIQLDAPKVFEPTHDYITDIAKRANRDVDNGDYDSAVTKARTLLEEVFCHAIEAKGEAHSDKGDIGRLYGQVKSLYNMHTDKDTDKRINMLLSGLEKILTAISQMRNENSDAHGVGSSRIKISEHHARLFVNSAITMADFILSVEQNQCQT